MRNNFVDTFFITKTDSYNLTHQLTSILFLWYEAFQVNMELPKGLTASFLRVKDLSILNEICNAVSVAKTNRTKIMKIQWYFNSSKTHLMALHSALVITEEQNHKESESNRS